MNDNSKTFGLDQPTPAQRPLSTNEQQMMNSFTDRVSAIDRIAKSVSPATAAPAPSGLDNQIAATKAMAGLSNTDRYALENPRNAPYKAGKFGAAPGSAAEASALDRRADILNALRNNSAGAPIPGYAGGGKIAAAAGRSLTMAHEERGIQARRAKRAGEMAAAQFYNGGGKIQGPGTATSDSIPAEVEETGEPIRVSNGERILSAKQDLLLQKIAKLSGFKSVDAWLEHMTGQPVGPTLKFGKRAAATGMSPEDQYGRPDATTSLAPLNGQPTRAGNYPSKLEQAVMGSQVVPAAPNISRDVLPIPAVQQVQNQLAASAPAPTVPKVSHRAMENSVQAADQGSHPQSIPASRPGAFLAGEDPSFRVEQGTPTLRWNSQNNVAADSIDRQTPLGDGTGIVSVARQGGGYKNVVIAPAQYQDTEGNPTSDWSKTAQYQQGVETAARMKTLAENMRRDRLERDATSPEITDPNARARATAGLLLLDAGRAASTSDQLQQEQLRQIRSISDIERRLSDPRTPEPEQKRLATLIATLRGHGDKQSELKVHDVEEPIDPANPLLGMKKVPYVYDPRSGANRPMLQGAQPQNQDVIAQAKAAIARGADPKAVNARLRAMGLQEVK